MQHKNIIMHSILWRIKCINRWRKSILVDSLNWDCCRLVLGVLFSLLNSRGLTIRSTISWHWSDSDSNWLLSLRITDSLFKSDLWFLIKLYCKYWLKFQFIYKHNRSQLLNNWIYSNGSKLCCKFLWDSFIYFKYRSILSLGIHWIRIRLHWIILCQNHCWWRKWTLDLHNSRLPSGTIITWLQPEVDFTQFFKLGLHLSIRRIN